MPERFGPREGMVTRFIKKHARAALAAGMIGSIESDQSPVQKEAVEKEPVVVIEHGEGNEFFDNKPEYFTRHPRGEYTKGEREARTTTLKNGEQIFKDVDLVFYKVKSGDTISEIRERLGKYPQFAYLKEQTNKLESFNIPARSLQKDMWLPIPLENEDRHLTDKQFAGYAAKALRKMVKDPHYGDEVKQILKKASAREVVATMLAIAKQESGGRPIGNFEMHRWEKKYKAFSFSLFHVLMEGAGLEARRKLGMTEGQTYHPENAAQLFLAFMCQKGNAPSYFPINEHEKQLAVFYNGSGWKKINPHYVENINSYYASALATLDTMSPILAEAE